MAVMTVGVEVQEEEEEEEEEEAFMDHQEIMHGDHRD